MLNLKINPETIIILPFAIMIDAIGVVLICFGLDDFGITDTIAMVTLGAWVWFRKGINVKIAKKDFKRGLKFLGTTLAEYVPYLGALPFWTLITVIPTLTETNEENQEAENNLEEERTTNQEVKNISKEK